jgi:hypothetical protein
MTLKTLGVILLFILVTLLWSAARGENKKERVQRFIGVGIILLLFYFIAYLVDPEWTKGLLYLK